MRIAILGGGFAGLAVTWFILHYSQGAYTVDLYDPAPIAGGASGLSSGMLHVYTGKYARLAWEGQQCLNETHRLITVASQALSRPIVLSRGILRPALTTQQIADFKHCTEKYADTEWWDKKTCERKVSGLVLPTEGGGLYIREGLTLDVHAYLEGLWKACAFHGTQYYQQRMISPEELASYDRILIAMGPFSKNFPPLKDLPITPVKGQVIELRWPDNLEPLAYSLNSHKYIVMRPDRKSCLIGSTYEHQFTHPNTDLQKALEDILPNILEFFPSLKNAEILNIYAALRASSPTHLPWVGKLSDKFYFFTGLGSKGLLYHSWIGKYVARALLTTHEKHFPEKLYCKL